VKFLFYQSQYVFVCFVVLNHVVVLCEYRRWRYMMNCQERIVLSFFIHRTITVLLQTISSITKFSVINRELSRLYYFWILAFACLNTRFLFIPHLILMCHIYRLSLYYLYSLQCVHLLEGNQNTDLTLYWNFNSCTWM